MTVLQVAVLDCGDRRGRELVVDVKGFHLALHFAVGSGHGEDDGAAGGEGGSCGGEREWDSRASAHGWEVGEVRRTWSVVVRASEKGVDKVAE